MPVELPDGWRDELPEEIRQNGALDSITTIDQMAKMVVDGRALASNAVRVPSEDASAEVREQFLKDLQTKVPDLVYVGEGADLSNLYDRMGRPKEPTEYEVGEVPDPLKENFAGLTAKAHELGVTKSQMKGLAETILTDFNNSQASHAGALEQAVDEIKKEYGEAYEKTLSTTADFAKRVGFDDSLVDAVKQGHVGVDNMKALQKVMEGFNSPGPRIGDDPGQNEFTSLTPEQAELQLAEIQNNKEHPYWDGAHPGHDAAVKKYVELVRAADAGKPQSETDKFRDAVLGRG